MRGHGKPLIHKRRVVLATATVKRNPGVVDITALRSPIHGGPLEPPLEYGKSIAYDPYTHSYVYVTPKGETERVTPTFTKFYRRGLAIVKPHIKQAGEYAKEGKLELAMRKLWDAQMAGRPHYKGAGFERDPIWTEIGEAYNEASNMLGSAQMSTGEAAKKFKERGLSRVMATAHAMREAEKVGV